MRYNELNKSYEDLRTLNFCATMSEPNVAQIIKHVFAHYLGVSDCFIPDDMFPQKCIPVGNVTEINGWSYVSLYACNKENKLELVRDFDRIKIPQAIIDKAPSELKAQIPTEINTSYDYGKVIHQIRSWLFNKPEYADFANQFDQFINTYFSRQYYFDSVTNNGYFIFYLGICFASSERSYPKNIITIKLGISLHKDDIVELAIFDTKSEYEKVCFLLNLKNINAFELSTLINDTTEIKKYLERLNLSNKQGIDTVMEPMIDLISTNDIYKNLYTRHSKEVEYYPNHKKGDFITKERRIKEYIQFNVEDISKWINLINSEPFKKLSKLIPDDVLERMFLRYKWSIEKNYNYYYKQINLDKDKAYLRQGGTIIHKPIYNNASNSTYNKQHSMGDDQNNIVNNSSSINQTNKKAKLSLTVLIKEVSPSIFGSFIGTGIVLTISKLDLIINYMTAIIKSLF